MDNIADLESPLIETPQYFANVVRSVADAIGARDMCVVGGAVRDCVLGKMSGHVNNPKDFDVILPAPLVNPESNPNIIYMRKNSLGGMKLNVENFGTVDVFQYYTKTPENIIANFFDFNCNSIFYRMRDNKIISSVFFQEFLESRTIRQQHIIYSSDGILGQYGAPQTVARALKFQIQFMKDYDIKTNLGYDILYLIYNMKAQDEDNMKHYMASHVADKNLQKLIWQNYQRIRK